MHGRYNTSPDLFMEDNVLRGRAKVMKFECAIRVPG